ncbi:MAG: hypothetical protein QOD75_2266 [Blastocatellia bacterium]|jgi:CheY-like chemotaxis protein|nr:hypothetical protein [Blastocatellia bacterium]
MSNPQETETPSEALSVSTSDEQLCVLLVEDDRAVRRYLQVILERAGYEVICAGDGLEAMKIALAQPLAAVVTDAIMPHLSGQELCRFLRSYPALATLPIILLSAFEGKTSPAESGAVADVSLVKPVKPEELTAQLARLIAEKAGA